MELKAPLEGYHDYLLNKIKERERDYKYYTENLAIEQDNLASYDGEWGMGEYTNSAEKIKSLVVDMERTCSVIDQLWECVFAFEGTYTKLTGEEINEG